MRARIVSSAAVVLTMALANHAQAQGGPPAMDPETEALMKQALIDARALAGSSLPDRARLGPDWKTAWELPASNPARVASEDEYWNRTSQNMGFAGFDEARARKMIDELLAQFGPMAAKEGMTNRDAILAMLIRVRSDNAPTALKTCESWETAALTMRAAEQMGDKKPDPRAGQRMIFDLFGAPYKSLSDDQLKDAFVKQAALAQKRTQMTYYLCNNWAGLAQARTDEDIAKAGIWLGMIRVNLLLTDPYKTSEPIDLKKEDAPALQSRILAAVKETASRAMAMQQKKVQAKIDRANASGDAREVQRLQEQLRNETASAQSLDAKVEMLGYGDNSYFVRISGVSPDTVGMQFGMYNGWIRKGPAMAEVSVGGNMPQKEMDLVMKKVLDELDAKLDSYDSSMFATISVAGGLPTAPAIDKPNGPVINPPTGQEVNPPITVNPPIVTPPIVTPPVVNPPVITPPVTDPPEYTQGLDAWKIGDIKSARQAFEQALQRSPNNPRVLLMLASAKYHQNDLPGALADYRTAAQVDPNNAQLRSYWALIELLAGDARIAGEQSEAAMRLAPNDPAIMLVRAQAAVALDRHDEAKQLFAAVAKANPQRASTLFNEANDAYNRQSYIAAILQFESVLMLDPNLYQAHYGRAASLAALGKNKGAIVAYQQYLQSDSTTNFAAQARSEIERLKRLR